MFGFTQILRHARQWQADRKRTAMQAMFEKLPLELQKDIGWPAARDLGRPRTARHDVHARPTLL
ncbi:hypothetical protein [Hoeflea ulvae]|uniref:DUF1127 domain-containing protein n=1 Tax=Hoeflea ulvae TaxID=2983764 RepID=A0ABT3YJX1_9HYPH|nr:hypothetical protein [Hoeflea ulvae]MCY0095927.1 hypothetical protein [Hoeflea ulvae]